jgi:alanyl-tRNA synthetase
MLNTDEVDDLDEVWTWLAGQLSMDVTEVRQAIEPVRDIYILLDHTRTVMMAIEDGSLPSNVGGASNVRNVLRRVFALITNTPGWWEKLGGIDGLMHIFACHKKDLGEIYGAFSEYKSFRPIIELEYARWRSTDEGASAKLQKLLKKNKGTMSLADWMNAVESWGVPVDVITKMTGFEPPGNLWYAIAENQEKTQKKQPPVLYATATVKPTVSLYYDAHLEYDFEAKITAVFANCTKQYAGMLNVVALDQSHFYPTSGGQDHDTGTLTIKGVEYHVIDAVRVGPCVLHILDKALPMPAEGDQLDIFVGWDVTGKVNEERRDLLRNLHTATHIMYSSARTVLGPHVWQNGARKQTHQAHLDITHFKSLSDEEVLAIENEANRVIRRGKQITKDFQNKKTAEAKHGFHLYQGGVVPGNELRVVSIADTDTEACCGTHADNTSEIGCIKVMRSVRISDGIVRLYYVAGDRAMEMMNGEKRVLNELTAQWGVGTEDLVITAEKFFTGYKKFSAVVDKQTKLIFDLQMRNVLLDQENGSKVFVFASDLASPTACISYVPPFVAELKAQGKGVVFVGETWVYALFGSGDKVLYDSGEVLAMMNAAEAAAAEKEAKKAEGAAREANESASSASTSGNAAVAAASSSAAAAPVDKKAAAAVAAKKALKVIVKNNVTPKPKTKKEKKVKVTDITEVTCFATPAHAQTLLIEHFASKGFKVES